MITAEAFDQWRRVVPWTSPHEVEQDLILARLIAEVAQHPVVGGSLALKGGTCLHKLWLSEPWRYSEDLDYDICGEVSLDDVKTAIAEIGPRVGFSDSSARMGQAERPIHHTRLQGSFGDGAPMAVKLDVDPHAGESALPYAHRPFTVDSPWFQANVEVVCYEPAELLASKVAALYGRRRHRDLFDIWAALKADVATPEEVAGCFERYRPEGWTARLAANNLRAKLDRPEYTAQLAEAAAHRRGSYDLTENVELAAALIDVCAEATQPSRRWRRVLSSKGTASDILGAWRHQRRGASSHGCGLGATRRSVVPQPTLKDKILAARRSHPAASPAWIAERTGASRSYVNAVLRQDRRTRGGR